MTAAALRAIPGQRRTPKPEGAGLASATPTTLDPIIAAAERERLKRGMQVTELARHVGVNVGHWLAVCRGTRHLSLPEVRRLCRALDWGIIAADPQRVAAETQLVVDLRMQLSSVRQELAVAGVSSRSVSSSPAERLAMLLDQAARIPGLPGQVHEELDAVRGALAGRVT